MSSNATFYSNTDALVGMSTTTQTADSYLRWISTVSSGQWTVSPDARVNELFYGRHVFLTQELQEYFFVGLRHTHAQLWLQSTDKNYGNFSFIIASPYLQTRRRYINAFIITVVIIQLLLGNHNSKKASCLQKSHWSTLSQSNQRWCKKMGQTVTEKSGRDFTMRHHDTFKLQRDL